MAETRRALKPGGTLHFAEHVRPRGAFGRVLDMVAPAWERIAAGCHPNRRTVEDIRGAGFDTRELRRGRLSGVLPLVSGVAVAPTYGREAGEP